MQPFHPYFGCPLNDNNVLWYSTSVLTLLFIQINWYYQFICILFDESIINHINETLFFEMVYLQINYVCLYVSANERIIQTNANIYKLSNAREWCPKFSTWLNIKIGCSSKIIWVIKLSYGQNDPLKGESF